MKYIYILKTGETFEGTKSKLGDFEHWIRNFLGKSYLPIKVIDILHNEKLPALKSAAGFIISGSHSMVSEEASWSKRLEKHIKKIDAKHIPLLGICYGHQLIAKALGGKSGYNTKGKEIGRSKIKIAPSSSDDLLLKDFPKQFYGFETHLQSALKLPQNAVVLASNNKDKHQAVRFSKYTWGVQFHPEFNRKIMKEYIVNQDETLKDLGFQPDILLKKATRCTISHKILSNFMHIVKTL